MKNLAPLFLSLLLSTLISLQAQSPEAISYQGVARDAVGEPLPNATIGLQFTFLEDDPTGVTVYEETHSVTTNNLGLFSLHIGKGTAVTGTFGSIDWARHTYFLKVGMDPAGGVSYTDLGTSELVSTPYSLFSKEAGMATDMSLGELKDVVLGSPSSGEVLAWNGLNWVPAADQAGHWAKAGNNLFYDQGYVGIGVLNPTVGLDISSAAGYGSAIALNNTGGGLEWRITSWTDGTLRLVKTSGTTFSAMVIEPTDGYVGIGTSTPRQKLSVHTSSGISYINVSDNTTGPNSGLRMGLSGVGNAYIINDHAGKALSLGTDGTTRMRITDAGWIGINTLAPGQLVHIRQVGANRGLRIQHQSTTDYWGNGIGTTTKNYKFYYNNLFRADISSTDGAYTQSSDRRLKKDIQSMEGVLGKVMQLRPFTYHYIDNSSSATRSMGFIAQDVEPLFPDLVRDSDEGYKGLVYDGFAVISIKAIQELNQKMEAMQAEIDALKKALNQK
jgi:hypothetical protein